MANKRPLPETLRSPQSRKVTGLFNFLSSFEMGYYRIDKKSNMLYITAFFGT